MPLVAHTNLPTFQRLVDEGEDTLDPVRAGHQHIRELHIGLLNIIAHNLWVADWRLMVTLFGWFVFIKGITRFAFPKIATMWIDKFDRKWFQFVMFLFFLIGIVLLNQAYGWVQF